MLRLLRRSAIPPHRLAGGAGLCHLHQPHPSPDSLTISYLINSCGLPRAAALRAAAKLHLTTTDNPDSVLSLLSLHGFSKPQISSLVSKHPPILLSKPQKTLLPKLSFFSSVGFSPSNLAKLLSADPNLLLISLDNRLVPNFDLLKSILGSNLQVIAALKGNSRLLRYDLHATILPNMDLLQRAGVPSPKIATLVTVYPRVLMQNTDRIAKTVGDLKQLGFNPSSTMFILGVTAMSGITDATWRRKMELYKSLGWSEKETLAAFVKHPFCMLASDQKIKKAIMFFVERLGWSPAFLAQRPKILSLSLEKRIMPRCSVYGVLVSKGLVSKRLGIHTFLLEREKEFLDKFVNKYRDEVPEVIEAYEGNKDFVELARRSREELEERQQKL